MFFHSSSLVRFLTRRGVMFAWHKSLLGSNFFFCISRYKFNMSAFVNGCINVNDVLRQHCLLDRDDQRVGTVQFLREPLFMLLVTSDV